MPKTVGAENIRSVSVSPTEEEEFYDYEFYFSVFAKTEFFYTLELQFGRRKAQAGLH